MDAHKPADEALPFSQSLAMFWRRPSLRMVMIGSGLAAFVSYGMLNWILAFLMRTQKMPLDAMATWFGPAAGITFGIGILGGGWLVSHHAQHSARAYGTIPALTTAVVIPTLLEALWVDKWNALVDMTLIPS